MYRKMYRGTFVTLIMYRGTFVVPNYHFNK